MLSISDTSFHGAWRQLLSHLWRQERWVAPRGMKVKEELGVSLRVSDSLLNVLVGPARGLNYRFMVAEWFWILGGFSLLEMLTPYMKKYAEYSDDGLTLAGAYGPRLRPQWSYVLDKLLADRDTRQAVASIWTPDPAPSKDIPCTLSAQFLVREDVLHTIVTMRSSDVWLGLPYDFFTFSQLASWVATVVKATPGSLTFNIGSSHLYETHADRAAEVLTFGNELDSLRSPRLPTRLPPATELAAALAGRPVLMGDGLYQGYVSVLRAVTKDALEVLRGLSAQSTAAR